MTLPPEPPYQWLQGMHNSVITSKVHGQLLPGRRSCALELQSILEVAHMK